MPFTFAHPALVLPFNGLRRGWVSMTALVIGSMTPDFEYFLHMAPARVHGHSVSGIFWFNMPLALALCFLYHNLVRNPLINHLPLSLQQKFFRYKGFRWNYFFQRNWVLVLCSLLLGVLTHLFADSFTNAGGYFVTEFTFLRRSIPFADTQIAYNAILYNFISVFGLATVAYAVWQLPKDKFIEPTTGNDGYWTFTGLATAFIAVVAVSQKITPEMRSAFWLFTPYFVIILISSFFLALVIVSALFKIKKSSAKVITYWPRRIKQQHRFTKKALQ